ncbi:hypothetical protein MLD38_001885 [Melastoma candidum]|uniref:Uncharacterized protein n=1 Tax=Melastoma candidum TaxID=119954 RepID=A0ACB9SES6_9MYRT|nr:hypothetical protein MLD38_001885 [Melastoma candidum]
MDDNVAVIGDWVPPSLTPMTFFSAMLSDDIGMKPQENQKSNRPSSSDGMNFPAVGHMETRPGNTGYDYSTEGSLSTEPRSNYRSGLRQRIAARAGFNAPRLNTEGMRSAELLANPEVRSPYLTISPGLSPTTLLDSPVFLSNSLAQPSPTTGKFPFFPNNIDSGSGFVSNASNKSQFEGNGTSSFAFKPVVDSGGSSFIGSRSKVNSFPQVDACVHSKSSFQSHNGEQSKVQPQNDSAYHGLNEYSRQPIVDGPDCSPTLNDQVEDEGDLKGSLGDPVVGFGGEPANDGYNWRKYGQKQVKGSKYPRSYYKCTHANCQVKKQVERSYEGHITEIIYKGVHKHSKPSQDRQSVIARPDGSGEVPGDDRDPAWARIRKAETAEADDWRPENNREAMSSPSEGLEVIGNPAPSLPAQNRTHFGSADHVDGSSTFSNDEGEDDRQTHVSASMGNDEEGDEFESKRRKIEAYASDLCGATRAIREPRVVVQTTSEVDILDDGYRWRKYGQKVVKGNPNPRSYYKCTSARCSVRKHVERASHDLKSEPSYVAMGNYPFQQLFFVDNEGAAHVIVEHGFCSAFNGPVKCETQQSRTS